jgi:hypothetical protein
LPPPLPPAFRDRVVASLGRHHPGHHPGAAGGSLGDPAGCRAARTDRTEHLADAGLPPVADIYIGFVQLPYYLVPPSRQPDRPADRLLARRAGRLRAAVQRGRPEPDLDQHHLRQPVPGEANGRVRAPVLMTVPNANSGRTKPAAGWPVVIFQHGITRNRSDALAISATMAAQGFAVVAIDQPLHGLPGEQSAGDRQHARSLAAGVRERTFDVDYINNSTGAAGPDGTPDASGTHMHQPGSLLTSRDNLRQGVADLFVLTADDAASTSTATAPVISTPRASPSSASRWARSSAPLPRLEPERQRRPAVGPGRRHRPHAGRLADLRSAHPRRSRAAAGLQPGTPSFDQFLGADPAGHRLRPTRSTTASPR